MAGTKISDATLRSTLKGTENIPITDKDLPKGRVSTDILKSWVRNGLVQPSTWDWATLLTDSDQRYSFLEAAKPGDLVNNIAFTNPKTQTEVTVSAVIVSKYDTQCTVFVNASNTGALGMTLIVNGSAANVTNVNPLLTEEHAQETYQPKGNYLTSVPGEYITETELEAKGYETKENASQTYATKTELDEVAAGLEAMKPYCLARWEDGELDPESVETVGDKKMLAEWHPLLLDTTDNAGVATHPVGQLKRNNYLRFEDGKFAPTIGITEEQRAQCDVELYLDAAHQQKYCEAGAFDPVAFYNQYGMAQKLYNAAGEEITHILRPWETTETKYSIGLGRKDTVYLIDQIRGKSGKVWRGLSTVPQPFDGIDASQWKLVPTAICPGPSTTVGGKMRNFFFLYEGENNCKSANGQGNLCTMFSNGRTYPRVNDVHQVSNMNYARANNADPEKPYPFAEGGYHAWNTFVTAMEVLFGTKALHRDTMFGSGISSNDACNNEETWKLHGGVRYKPTSSSDWKYGNWNLTPSDIFYNATQGKTYFSAWVNQEYPKQQCMEAQMAASFAVETGVAEGEEFSFYGGTYWYETPTGVPGLKDGEMNVRVYKKMTQTINAYNAEGAEQSFDIEVILRMGLMQGVDASGDIFGYRGGGYEQVGTVKYQQETQRTGNPVDLYIMPDQTKWQRETTFSKNDLGTFPFESGYIKIGTYENLGDSYAAKRVPYATWKSEKGGNSLQGEGFYTSDNNYWGNVLNSRYRIAVRLRGHANRGTCSARYMNANFAASSSLLLPAGSAQALLDWGAAPPQAE